MRHYLERFRYLCRHKYIVYRAGRKLDVPIWRLIIHDWSKLLPSEFFPYVEYFFNGGKNKTQARNAFRLHYIRNAHHWNHWVLLDSDGVHALEMPDVLVREMIADWLATGLCKTGQIDLPEYYNKIKDEIILHTITRALVETYMQELLQKWR